MAKRRNGKVYDPYSGEELKWDQNTPRTWDMGHKFGKEYKKLHQDYMNTRVRDSILKSKEQKNIQPTKGDHKMVTYQNYVSLFYCQITSCPPDGGIS